MNDTERFEHLAQQFLDDTGSLVPGKDMAAADNSPRPPRDVLMRLWNEWQSSRQAFRKVWRKRGHEVFRQMLHG